MPTWIKIITLCAALAAPGMVLANADQENGEHLSAVFDAIENNDWVSADNNHPK